MNKIQKFIQQFGPYLEDIRKRLYLTTILFVVAFVSGFAFAGPLLRILINLFRIDNVIVATTSPFQLANLSMDIGFFVAFSITIPVIIIQFYFFIASALSAKEKKGLFTYIPASVVLFLLGFVYSFAILYYSYELFASMGNSIGVKSIWDIGSFVSQTYMTALFLGFIFEMPIILTILIRIGWLKVDFLRKKRRISYVIITILVSLLPPTDALSLIVMTLPLILLYEASIFINRKIK